MFSVPKTSSELLVVALSILTVVAFMQAYFA